MTVKQMGGYDMNATYHKIAKQHNLLILKYIQLFKNIFT